MPTYIYSIMDLTQDVSYPIIESIHAKDVSLAEEMILEKVSDYYEDNDIPINYTDALFYMQDKHDLLLSNLYDLDEFM